MIKLGETVVIRQQLCNTKVEWRNEAGQLHRIDGPAVEHSDGTKAWYVNGQRHRIDGPAVEYNSGTKYWYVNGQLHRIDGPAIEWSDGTKSWYVNGKRIEEYLLSTKIGRLLYL